MFQFNDRSAELFEDEQDDEERLPRSRLLGSGRNSRQLNSATNDANDGSDGSSDAGDANTGSNNIGNQDSSRRNTACSRLEHQIQKSHALQPWLDSVPRQPDRARREVVTDTFSYV